MNVALSVRPDNFLTNLEQSGLHPVVDGEGLHLPAICEETRVPRTYKGCMMEAGHYHDWIPENRPLWKSHTFGK